MNLIKWMNEHPARAGAITGWYQQACSWAAWLILVPVITFALGSPGAGVWYWFQTLLLFLGVMDFGFSQVIGRQVAHLSHKSPNSAYIDETDFIDLPEGWTGIAEVHAISRKIFRQVVFVALGLLVIIQECLIPFGRIVPERTVSTTLAWYFLGGATLLALATRPYQAVLEGIGKLYASNLILGSYQLVTTVTLIVVARQVPDMAWMGLAVFGLAGLQLEAFRRAFNSFIKAAPGRSNCRRPVPGLAKQIRKVAAPLGIVNLAAMMVSSIQVPLLGFLLGPVKVTGFFLAQKMS